MNLRSTTTTSPTPTPTPIPHPTPKSPPSGRLFSEQDEIKLLKAYKRSIRKNPNSTPSSLSFGKFTSSQITSKIKRLKQKYHKMAKTKSNIKTHQDRKIYLLGRKIWAKNDSKVSKNDENGNNLKTQDDEGYEDGVFGDGLDLENGKADVDLENSEKGGKISKVSENGENNGFAPKKVIFEDGLGFDNGNAEKSLGGNGGDLGSGKSVVDLENSEKGGKISKVLKNGENNGVAPKDVIFEDGLGFDNGNAEKSLRGNGGDLGSGKSVVDLEKFPFLMENVSEEVTKTGFLYFEALKGLGEEKLRELDDKWMILSMQKAEIETEKSLLFQKQFILVADARRRM